jgi:hypothetical protein
MIPHVSANIHEDAIGFEMLLNEFEFVGFVKFSYYVMGLKKVTAISDKKSKGASIFLSRHQNSFSSGDLADPLCYRKSCRAAQKPSSCALPYACRHRMVPCGSREFPNSRVVPDNHIPAPNSGGTGSVDIVELMHSARS